VSYGAADFENRQFGNTEPPKGIRRDYFANGLQAAG
jgi:hypothetical protein